MARQTAELKAKRRVIGGSLSLERASHAMDERMEEQTDELVGQ